MTRRLTAYELSESQVATPQPVVSLFWQLVKQHRKRLGTVLDMGAGDCRFAMGGHFKKYVGVEIDKHRAASAEPPKNGKLLIGCVFRHEATGYDACIGNPPYARHHDIETAWKDQTVSQLERALTVSLHRNSNLYIHFFGLALLKSRSDGLVGLVIPYEWVSRPSARPLREYISQQEWTVAVYRFQMPIFAGVMTTASITIVDKAHRARRWKYFDITPDYEMMKRQGPTESPKGVLGYATRGKAWALRGLSPGSQKVFTLTEGERVRAGLTKRDVVPCVTTLRNVPRSLRMLSKTAFQKHFVNAGRRCWLVRSHAEERSTTLDAYLASVPEKDRQTYTCLNQDPWFKYLPHPVPQMLFSSGFTTFGPKVLLNSASARAVGSVWGIHSESLLPLRRLQTYLVGTNFERRVVPHAKILKKVEVKQLNGVLNAFVHEENKNGRKRPR